MTVIFAPTGGLAQRAIVPMSARQVTWFIDPEALLRHLNDLHVLNVAAYCQHCYKNGLEDAVSAIFKVNERAFEVHCACADYPLIHDLGSGPMEIRKFKDDGTPDRIRVHSVDELLFRLGWSFKCVGDCARLGMQDGVEGNNDVQAHTIKVSCGCTVRTYQEPSGLPS